jgi:tRNA(Ile)-lysidine synthetase-like protein
VVRSAIEQTGGTPTARDIEALLGFADAHRTEGRLDLHRLTILRRGPILLISPRVADASPDRQVAVGTETDAGTLLPVPGRADLKETGVVLLASFLAGTEAGTWQHGAATAGRVALQAGAVQPPLVVRKRKPGDRFHPLGAPGARRLQDVLVDRKVPRSARDRVPVVVDASGRIVWVAGVSIAHHCRVTAPEAGMVILELEKDPQ